MERVPLRNERPFSHGKYSQLRFVPPSNYTYVFADIVRSNLSLSRSHCPLGLKHTPNVAKSDLYHHATSSLKITLFETKNSPRNAFNHDLMQNLTFV